MKLYKCLVRLSGLVHHEVPKYGVTDKEVAILRTIHGTDAVVQFRPDGEAKRTNTEEYERLAMIYGEGLVTKLFGNVLSKLTNIQVEDDDEFIDVPDVTGAMAENSQQAKIPVMNLTNPEVPLD